MFLNKGDRLFCEGDICNELYIVMSGELLAVSANEAKVYRPGDLIGELNLLKNELCQETITAIDDVELQIISKEILDKTLQNQSPWIKSIVMFLSERLSASIAKKQSSDKIKALPSLLYEINNQSEETISLQSLYSSLSRLFNAKRCDIVFLLETLQELDLLKLHSEFIYVKNAALINLLYKTIKIRATSKTLPQQILSIAEQTVLLAIIRTVQQSNAPLKNGLFTINCSDLLKVAKRSMHGVSLTMRMVKPLIERSILTLSEPSATELENVQFIFGDFENILNLVELNRIFPLLDKKLIE